MHFYFFAHLKKFVIYMQVLLLKQALLVLFITLYLKQNIIVLNLRSQISETSINLEYFFTFKMTQRRRSKWRQNGMEQLLLALKDIQSREGSLTTTHFQN
jgi:hypothetical protein